MFGFAFNLLSTFVGFGFRGLFLPGEFLFNYRNVCLSLIPSGNRIGNSVSLSSGFNFKSVRHARRLELSEVYRFWERSQPEQYVLYVRENLACGYTKLPPQISARKE